MLQPTKQPIQGSSVSFKGYSTILIGQQFLDNTIGNETNGLHGPVPTSFKGKIDFLAGDVVIQNFMPANQYSMSS